MATPLDGEKSIAQKLHENLTWMREHGASVEEQHAEIAKAQAAIDRKNQADQDAATKIGPAQKVAEAVVSGLPGAQRAVAGYRGALSLAGIGSETPDEALSQQKEDVASLPGTARIPLQLLGGAPAAALAAPLGVTGGGAAIGAAFGADRPAESLGERAKNMAVEGAIGGVAGKALQLGGRGIANVANRVGLPDKLAALTDRISPKLAASSGTRGQVNQAFQDRADILGAVGDEGATAGKLQTDRIAATKAKAADLYDAARQDKGVVEDPRVAALLKDPQVAKAMEVVSGIREASGNPLPRSEAPQTVPASLSSMGVPQARYEQLMALAQKRGGMNTGIQFLAPELKGVEAAGVEMPDPEAIHALKRYLYDAAQGRADSPLGIKQDEARALMPKVDELRNVLHEISPAWKEADAFYSDAKGQEEAFKHGFDAFRKSYNPSGEQLPTNTVEAMQAEIAKPRFPNESPEAMQNRVEAFRSGIRAAMGEGVRGSPVEAKARAALGTTPFLGDEQTQRVRSLAFDDPAKQSAMEQIIATKRGAAKTAPRPETIRPSEAAYHSGPKRMAISALISNPDRLNTSLGQNLIQMRQADPQLLADELAKAKGGDKISKAIADLLALSGAGQATRP